MLNSRLCGVVCSLLLALSVFLGSSSVAAAQEMEMPQEQIPQNTAKPQEPATPAIASEPTGTPPAAESAVKTEAAEVLNTTDKVKIAVFFMNGMGSESIDVGRTTDGDAVKLSGGGGLGFEIAMGFGLSQRLELDVSMGSQSSTEMPAVENANVSFSRSFLRTTLKYLVLGRDRIRLKFGAGVGVYSGGELDIDTSQVAGGGHDIIRYNRALGPHLVGEFEGLIRDDLTFVAGLRLYKMTYTASSWQHNGVEYNYKSLPGDVRYLDGSGADLFIGIAKYF